MNRRKNKDAISKNCVPPGECRTKINKTKTNNTDRY